MAHREKSKRRLPLYKPAPKEVHDAILTVLAQCEAKDRDPQAPEPDIGLLAKRPFGPIRSLDVGPDPDTREPSIWIGVQDRRGELRHPRCFPLRAALAVLALIMPGHGMSVNKSTPADPGGRKVLSYVKLFTGRDKMTASRILTDARQYQVVLNQDADGKRANHRNNDPRFYSLTTSAIVVAEGKPLRRPFRGRQYAIETALARLQINRGRADWSMTDQEFRELLSRIFAVLDAAYGSEAA